MFKVGRSQFWYYGFAAIVVAIAFGFTLLLQYFFPPTTYALFYAAVALSTYYGGMRAGLLATVLSIFCIGYFFIPPVDSLPNMSLRNLVQLGVFVLVTLIINSLNNDLRSARKRSERSLQALQTSEERYRVLAENVPQLVWFSRADGFVEYFNQRWYDYTGLTPNESLGWEWQIAIHPDNLSDILAGWKKALTIGTLLENQYLLRRADGNYRWYITRALPLRNFQGEITHWFGTCTDIHEQKQTEEALRQNQERFEFLANASSVLAATIDYEKTITAVARMAVPFLADMCMVDLFDEEHLPSLKRVAVAHIETAKEELLYEMARRYPAGQNEMSPLFRVIRDRESFLFPKIPDSLIAEHAQDAEHLRLIQSLGDYCSSMIVPLIARGKILGSICFNTTTASHRHYNAADLALAEDLARRIAIAVDNASLYQEAREAERQESSSWAFLDACMASASIGFVFFDSEGKYLRINESLAAMNNIPAAEHLGKSVWDILAPDLALDVESKIKQVTDNRKPILNIEQTGVTLGAPDRQGYWLVSYYPVLSEFGELLGVGAAVVDITERKQVEAALQESEARFRQLIENLHDVFWVYNPTDHKVLYVSPSYEKIWGRSCESLYVDSSQWYESIHPADRERVGATFSQENLADKFDIEYRIMRPDESICWIRDRGVTIKDNTGKIYRLVGIAEDTTRQKKDKETIAHLNQNLERRVSELQTLFEVIPIAIAIAQDPKCRFVRVNPTFAQILGVCPDENASSTPGENAPLPTYKLYHNGQQVPGAQMPMQYAASSGNEVRDVEVDIVREDGTVFNLYGYASPLFDEQGRSRGAVSAFLDLTERKRTEAALRETQQRFRVAQELSLDGFTILRSVRNEAGEVIDFTFDYVNPKGVEIIKCAPDNIIGKRLLEVMSGHKENSELFDRYIEVVQTGKPHDIEIYYDAEGVRGWFRNMAVKLGDSVAVSFKDITERKQEEVERQQLLEGERNARAQAEDANRIKDEFLAVLSHELRSPLNPILGWAKLLRSRKFEPAIADRALETIERNAKLQSQLIEDLLDVSRILRGKMHLNVAPVNPANIIEAAIETVRLAAEAKSIQIQTTIAANIGQISGDSSRLQQIVWNILSNAVKFTPEGGRIAVKLERIEQQSTEQCKNPIAYAQITVTDTGKGINPDFLPYVFDYFRQADSTTTRKFGGLGLGLAIVRHLVELHGGTVAVDSPGEAQGATFIVRLPLLQQSSNTNEQNHLYPASVIPHPLAGLCVLAVDDESDMREYVNCVLEESGAKSIVVASAAEALRALQEHKPDLLLSDIGMPNVDGYMLMQQVRALSPAQGGQVRAIALTAYAAEYDQRKALAVGFQMHLPKPVEPEKLLDAISKLLEGDSTNNK